MNVSEILNSEATLTRILIHSLIADIINIMIPKNITTVFHNDNFSSILFISVVLPLFLEIYTVYIKILLKAI